MLSSISNVYRAVALMLFFLVYIVGLVGNGLLIFIVFRQKHLRTVPNLLVVSLAMGDFLFVLFCVPFGAVAYSLEYYPFSTFYCRFENFIINLSLGVSVFSLLALSADRYQIIAKPFSSHAHDPSIKLKTVVISIWLLSIFLAVPETIYSGLIMETFNQTDNTTIELIYCSSPNESELLFNHKFMISREIVRVVVYYLMPLVFVSGFYILIAKHLFQAKNEMFTPIPTNSNHHDLSDSKRGPKRIKVVKSMSNTTLVRHNSTKEQKRHIEKSVGGSFKNVSSKGSQPVSNGEFVSRYESTQKLQRPVSSSSLMARKTQHSRDLCYTNSNSSNMSNTTQTLCRDVKIRKQMRARHKVAKTVLFLCSVFFICWLPKQIHDLYWFIGVIVYSARWNHFWQLNKTLALILSYVYSCINPFALYFLSTTFRHFYKRYLFFWTNKSCCRSKNELGLGESRRRNVDMMTISEYQRQPSGNNVTAIYYDLNRMKNSVYCQSPQHNHSLRIHRQSPLNGSIIQNGKQFDRTGNPPAVISVC